MSIDTLHRVTTPIFKVMCRVIAKQSMGKSSSFERCSTYINTVYNNSSMTKSIKMAISTKMMSAFSVLFEKELPISIQTNLMMVILVFLSPFIASSNNNEFDDQYYLDNFSHTELYFSCL